MRCAIPTCSNDSSLNFSPEVTFFQFPTDPKLRAKWLAPFLQEGWQPGRSTMVCSEHFLVSDMVETSGGCELRKGAVPVIKQKQSDCDDSISCGVKVCRICFATDCKLYQLTSNRSLYVAYETLTGLSATTLAKCGLVDFTHLLSNFMNNSSTFKFSTQLEDEASLPQYLCSQCSTHLLSYTQLRTRSLRAHLTLLEVIKKYECITLESIKSITESQSSKSQGHNEKYDLCTNLLEDNIQNDGTRSPNDDGEDGSDGETGDGVIYDDNVHVKIENDVIDSIVAVDISSLQDDISVEVMKAECDDESGDDIDVGDETAVFYNKGDVQNDSYSEDRKDCVRNISVGDHTSHVGSRYSKVQAKSTGAIETNLYHINNEELRCNICRYKTSSCAQMQKHQKSHSPKKYYCDQCSFVAKNKTSLRNHIRVHNDKRFTCNVCDKVFNVKCNLIHHLRLHSGEKPFSCNLCSRKFSRSDHLKLHSLIHKKVNGESYKPYACDVCDKTFTRRTILRQHMQVHSGVKSFSCESCDSVFSRECNLLSHMRIHSGEKPFSCNLCGNKFAHNSNLKSHLKKMHKIELLYGCDACDKQFNNYLNYKRHLCEKLYS